MNRRPSLCSYVPCSLPPIARASRAPPYPLPLVTKGLPARRPSGSDRTEGPSSTHSSRRDSDMSQLSASSSRRLSDKSFGGGSRRPSEEPSAAASDFAAAALH
jgi:hypothetical protein